MTPVDQLPDVELTERDRPGLEIGPSADRSLHGLAVVEGLSRLESPRPIAPPPAFLSHVIGTSEWARVGAGGMPLLPPLEWEQGAAPMLPREAATFEASVTVTVSAAGALTTEIPMARGSRETLEAATRILEMAVLGGSILPVGHEFDFLQGSVARLRPDLLGIGAESESVEPPPWGPLSTGPVVTPEAEEYARRHGLFGAVVIVGGVVHELFRSLKGIAVELRRDPEVVREPIICFIVTTGASVDEVLGIEEQLHQQLFSMLPVHDRLRIGFLYRFA